MILNVGVVRMLGLRACEVSKADQGCGRSLIVTCLVGIREARLEEVSHSFQLYKKYSCKP